jgi:hypothetical protein
LRGEGVQELRSQQKTVWKKFEKEKQGEGGEGRGKKKGNAKNYMTIFLKQPPRENNSQSPVLTYLPLIPSALPHKFRSKSTAQQFSIQSVALIYADCQLVSISPRKVYRVVKSQRNEK